MDRQLIEYLHNEGLMPDLFYYQQNGKSAQENFVEQRINLRERTKAAADDAVLMNLLSALQNHYE